MNKEYETGKKMLESLIEEYGLVQGFKKYYKIVLSGEKPDDLDN